MSHLIDFVSLNSDSYVFLGSVIGTIGAIVIAFITTSGKSVKEDHEQCEEKVKVLIVQIEEFENIIVKYNEFKFGFNIVFHEYEIMWRDNPEKMNMLLDLKKAFDK